MRKALLGLLVAGIIVCAALLAVKDTLARTSLIKGIRQAYGLEVSIEKVHVGLVPASLGIRGFKIYNPKGSPDVILADIPEADIAYDPFSLFTKQAHIREMKVVVKDLLIAQDKDHRNVIGSLRGKTPGSFKGMAAGVPGAHVSIDLLTLQIQRIVYKNYSATGDPRVIELNLHLNQSFEHISDLGATIEQIVQKFAGNAEMFSQFSGANFKPASKDARNPPVP